MFGTFFKRQLIGQRIAARNINQFIAPLERLTRLHVASPLTAAPVPGGYALGWGGPVCELGIWVPTDGPINAATISGSPPNLSVKLGSGEASRWQLGVDGTLVNLGATETIYNVSASAVGNDSTPVMCGLSDDTWYVLGAAGTEITWGVCNNGCASGSLSSPALGFMVNLVQIKAGEQGASAFGATVPFWNRYSQAIPARAMVGVVDQWGFKFLAVSDCGATLP